MVFMARSPPVRSWRDRMTDASSRGNGGRYIGIISQLPWMPIITLVGWVAFAISFYFSTKETLDAHSKQIQMITSTREKLLEGYYETIKRITENLGEQSRTSALRLQAIDSRLATIDQQI